MKPATCGRWKRWWRAASPRPKCCWRSFTAPGTGRSIRFTTTWPTDMAKGTLATVMLERAGVTFKLHEYDYDPDAPRIGMHAAEALGVSPARLLKTLMAKAGGTVVCV